MDETRTQTIADIAEFLTKPPPISLDQHGHKDDVYKWIECILVRFPTFGRTKRERG